MNFCSDDLHLHPCSMAYAAASHLPPNSPVWPLTIAPGAQLLLSACVTSANYQRTWMTIRRKERRAECMWQSAASFSPRSLPTPPTPPACSLDRLCQRWRSCAAAAAAALHRQAVSPPARVSVCERLDHSTTTRTGCDCGGLFTGCSLPCSEPGASFCRFFS